MIIIEYVWINWQYFNEVMCSKLDMKLQIDIFKYYSIIENGIGKRCIINIYYEH